MTSRVLLAGAASVIVSTASHAAQVTFTFPDPDGYPTFIYEAGNAMMPGLLRSTSTVDLLVDLTSVGDGVRMYTVEFEFAAMVGQAVEAVPGTIVSPLSSGTFSFVLPGMGGGADQPLLTATFASGALTASAGAGAAISTSNGGLQYTPFGELSSVLTGAGLPFLGPFADAVFTMTNVMPPFSINQLGYLNDFNANSAYTGSANAFIPLPSAAGLAALGLAPLALRRRAR